MLGLDVLINMLSRLEDRGLAVQALRCTRLRHRVNQCTRCADVCPNSAIQWSEGTLDVDPTKCTGCGACATVCPTSALVAIAPTDSHVATAAEAAGTRGDKAIFVCDRYLKVKKLDPGGAILVPCISRIDESMMIGAIAAGAPAVELIDGGCADCPQGSSHKVTEKTVAQTNYILSRWAKPALVQLKSTAPLVPADEFVAADTTVGVSRRSFFTMMRGEGAEAASGVIAKVVGSAVVSVEETITKNKVVRLSEYPRLVPAKRRYLLASLAKLGLPVEPEAETTLWANISMADSCVGCYGCVDFCPSGALAKFEHEAKLGIAFRSARCTGCGLCRDICYNAMRNEVIQISHVIRWSDLMNEGTTITMLKEKSELFDPNESTTEKMTKLLDASVASYGA